MGPEDGHLSVRKRLITKVSEPTNKQYSREVEKQKGRLRGGTKISPKIYQVSNCLVSLKAKIDTFSSSPSVSPRSSGSLSSASPPSSDPSSGVEDSNVELKVDLTDGEPLHKKDIVFKFEEPENNALSSSELLEDKKSFDQNSREVLKIGHGHDTVNIKVSNIDTEADLIHNKEFGNNGNVGLSNEDLDNTSDSAELTVPITIPRSYLPSILMDTDKIQQQSGVVLSFKEMGLGMVGGEVQVELLGSSKQVDLGYRMVQNRLALVVDQE